jgi:uncharacterized protein YyaL (SSP411 family)
MASRLALLISVMLLGCVTTPWNQEGIAWVSYEQGLERARREQKPIMLLMYTDWCPYCRKLSKQFGSADVERQSQDFIMVRVNTDERPDLSARFSPDGTYIPRVFFLAPDGTPNFDFVSSSGESKYSVGSSSNEHLLWLFSEARRRMRGAS